jgi:hypothetical protein
MMDFTVVVRVPLCFAMSINANTDEEAADAAWSKVSGYVDAGELCRDYSTELVHNDATVDIDAECVGEDA